MGKLVAFNPEAHSRAAPGRKKKAEIGEPPDDAIAGAAWLNKLLRHELHSVQTDPTLSTKERRDLVLKFARAITTSTPNTEIFEARELVRGEDAAVSGGGEKLGGELKRATKSRARPLRASAARGKADREPVH